jgi:hypothetical protein
MEVKLTSITELARILFLGLLVYVSPRLFFRLGGSWFSELVDTNRFRDNAKTLRKRFWRSFGLVFALTMVVLTVQYFAGWFPVAARNWLRIAAAYLALTATLGRAGWAIQSWNEQTVIERIDRGMYVIGQVGATVLLLFALGL